MCITILEICLVVFTKAKQILSLLPSNPLLDVYPPEMNAYVHLKIPARILTAAPFVIAQTGKNANILA